MTKMKLIKYMTLSTYKDFKTIVNNNYDVIQLHV